MKKLLIVLTIMVLMTSLGFSQDINLTPQLTNKGYTFDSTQVKFLIKELKRKQMLELTGLMDKQHIILLENIISNKDSTINLLDEKITSWSTKDSLNTEVLKLEQLKTDELIKDKKVLKKKLLFTKIASIAIVVLLIFI